MNHLDEIKKEAEFCAHCVTKPCQVGCPLNNDTTGFIWLIREGKYKEAFELLSNTTVLPAVCGRICPHEKQCQGMCVKRVSYRPVSIGMMEAFIGDMALQNHWQFSDSSIHHNARIAVIGAGPAGLTCAAFLKRNGYSVTIFERHNYLGGLLRHGIPEFRLPKKLLDSAIQAILDLGIEVQYDKSIGTDFMLEDLIHQYDAVFLGFGANLSSKMNIPGEELPGVYGGNELLENGNYPDYTSKTVVVSGGGNVAMDVSRTILRLGAKKVYVVYRRSEKESPAEKKELEDARKEGIEFLFQTNILQIDGKDSVQRVELIRTELKNVEGDSRPSPVNIEGSNYFLDCDYVVMAVGSHPEEDIVASLSLKRDRRGRIQIDDAGHTSNEKVFAGGDLAGSPGTVAFAARAGRNAAYAIIDYLGGMKK